MTSEPARIPARTRADAVRAELAAAGIPVTVEGTARARARRYAVETRWSPSRRAEVRRRALDAMRSELPAGDAATRAAPAA